MADRSCVVGCCTAAVNKSGVRLPAILRQVTRRIRVCVCVLDTWDLAAAADRKTSNPSIFPRRAVQVVSWSFAGPCWGLHTKGDHLWVGRAQTTHLSGYACRLRPCHREKKNVTVDCRWWHTASERWFFHFFSQRAYVIGAKHARVFAHHTPSLYTMQMTHAECILPTCASLGITCVECCLCNLVSARRARKIHGASIVLQRLKIFTPLLSRPILLFPHLLLMPALPRTLSKTSDRG